MNTIKIREIIASRLTPATALVLFLLTGVVLAGGGSQPGRPADEDEGLRILFSDNPNEPSGAKTDILFRPNKEQRFYLFVENPTNRDHKITVKLQGGNPPADLGASAPISVAAGKTQRFDFGKLAPPAPGMPLPFIAVNGPPYRFQLVITDEKGVELPPQVTYAGLLRPSQYLNIPEIRYESGTGSLSVTVTTLPQFSGPPAQVEMILSPSKIPGLNPASVGASGTSGTSLSKGETATLVAKDLSFLGSPPDRGLVYLSADNYERAFIFETTFTRQDTPVTPLRVAGRNPRLHLGCPRYSVQNAKFPVTLELDNVTRSDVILELGVDPAGTGAYKTQECPGDREQNVWLSPKSPDGAIVFKSEVKDWQRTLDLSKTTATLKLRGRLLDPNKKPLEIEDEGEQPTFEVFQPVTIDKTPPSVQFTEAPDKLGRGTQYTFHVIAEDKESGIESVDLFLDNPPKDEKTVPDVAERASAPRDENRNGVWTCTLKMPVDRTSTPVSVRAVNRAHLTTWSKPLTIQLADSAAMEAGEKPTTGTIKGTVKNAGGLPQPDLEVVLTNVESKKQVNKVKTDKGEFIFEKVPPGSYRLDCSKPEAQTKCSAEVVVEAGKVYEKDMVLGF
jgi:hypothetical protein